VNNLISNNNSNGNNMDNDNQDDLHSAIIVVAGPVISALEIL